MQNGIATLEDNLPVSYKAKYSLIVRSNNQTPWYLLSSVQLLSHVWLFMTPWTAACQASPSITNFRSLHKLMSIKKVMPSNHLILYRPLLLLPSIFLSNFPPRYLPKLYEKLCPYKNLDTAIKSNLTYNCQN